MVDDEVAAGPRGVLDRAFKLGVMFGIAGEQVVRRVKDQMQPGQLENFVQRTGMDRNHLRVGQQVSRRHPYLNVREAGGLI